MSSFSAATVSRRGSVVPPLDEAEKAPEKTDVLICGTGLSESILAAALAWQGTNVFVTSANDYYGDSAACLTIAQLKSWVDRVNQGHEAGFTKAQLYLPRPLESRQYIVDLSPKVMFARSDILSLLIKSRVYRYLEFKPLGTFHTYEEDSFEKVPGSREDIFTDQTLSLMTKRGLMRFMKFVLEWETQTDVWEGYQNTPVTKFLVDKFRLEEQQINELVFAIGLCSVADTPTPVALARIKRYLTSLDVYGNFPVLYSMYGSGGELAQGFSRSAAVAGATYKLGAKLVNFDEATGEATLSDGSRLTVAEKVVVSPDNLLPHTKQERKSTTITRLVAFVAKDCHEWFAENESAAIVVFPPKTLGSNKHAVQAQILGAGSGQCPEGQAAWYLSTLEPDESQARIDLQTALDKLEASILRESTEDFEVGDVDEDDVAYRADGLPVVSSVKLGKSMQNFVPKEKLQYLLKLGYRQHVALADAATVPPLDKKLVQSSYVLPEISYDGAVTVAKALYEGIVGSDDDFFDVDFEDEEAVAESMQRREQQAEAEQEASKLDEEIGHDMEL